MENGKKGAPIIKVICFLKCNRDYSPPVSRNVPFSVSGSCFWAGKNWKPLPLMKEKFLKFPVSFCPFERRSLPSIWFCTAFVHSSNSTSILNCFLLMSHYFVHLFSELDVRGSPMILFHLIYCEFCRERDSVIYSKLLVEKGWKVHLYVEIMVTRKMWLIRHSSIEVF